MILFEVPSFGIDVVFIKIKEFTDYRRHLQRVSSVAQYVASFYVLKGNVNFQKKTLKKFQGFCDHIVTFSRIEWGVYENNGILPCITLFSAQSVVQIFCYLRLFLRKIFSNSDTIVFTSYSVYFLLTRPEEPGFPLASSIESIK